jgi:hypothetical protein
MSTRDSRALPMGERAVNLVVTRRLKYLKIKLSQRRTQIVFGPQRKKNLPVLVVKKGQVIDHQKVSHLPTWEILSEILAFSDADKMELFPFVIRIFLPEKAGKDETIIAMAKGLYWGEEVTHERRK